MTHRPASVPKYFHLIDQKMAPISSSAFRRIFFAVVSFAVRSCFSDGHSSLRPRLRVARRTVLVLCANEETIFQQKWKSILCAAGVERCAVATRPTLHPTVDAILNEGDFVGENLLRTYEAYFVGQDLLRHVDIFGLSSSSSSSSRRTIRGGTNQQVYDLLDLNPDGTGPPLFPQVPQFDVIINEFCPASVFGAIVAVLRERLKPVTGLYALPEWRTAVSPVSRLSPFLSIQQPLENGLAAVEDFVDAKFRSRRCGGGLTDKTRALAGWFRDVSDYCEARFGSGTHTHTDMFSYNVATVMVLKLAGLWDREYTLRHPFATTREGFYAVGPPVFREGFPASGGIGCQTASR